MGKTAAIAAAAALSTIIGMSVTAQGAELSVVEEGKKIAFDRKRGNCLACHQIEGGQMPGNIGPPLAAMSTRFSDKTKLRAQIYDARTANPNTMMPPFGSHEILTEEEIAKVVEFVYSL